MSGWAWPFGKATREQRLTITRLRSEVEGSSVPLPLDLSRVQAAREIDRLVRLRESRRAGS